MKFLIEKQDNENKITVKIDGNKEELIHSFVEAMESQQSIAVLILTVAEVFKIENGSQFLDPKNTEQ